jgi:hypothetical protein
MRNALSLATLALAGVSGLALAGNAAAASRVLDRTMVCALGQGWVQVGVAPDVRTTPGILAVTGNSAAGTFPFVSIDTERGAFVDTKRCRGTAIRVPLSAKGLPGPPAVFNTGATCQTPGRVLVHVRYEYLPGNHAKGYVCGRMVSAALAFRVYKTRRPVTFARLTANGTKSKFFNAASCTV